MDDLVKRLSNGSQPVVIGGANPSIQDLEKRLTDIGFVFIKFTETNGGTDLGLSVDLTATRMDEVDFQAKTGVVHIEGTLILNFVPVRCIANIDISSMSGEGWLVLESSEIPT